ncbi:hypothetical protein [Photobacterium halotolerans]|uniref:Lipoprotein n=1 Tax=Photobacterium halotolerans TaxID=265726 RepID=A0A0F5VBX6_9GAMM|nr:hypothetical protein [Photobacterium halotolerans]KKC99567.1 hypothetical protein KY46_11570 [Photobacterium halotolerans]
MSYNRRIFITSVTVLGLILLQGCSSGDEETSAQAPTTSPIDKTMNVYLPARTDKKPNTKNPVFQFTNVAYFRENLDYDNPAQFTIFDDGTWEYYAERILNKKITGGEDNSGGAWTQTFYVKYYSDWDQYKKTCAGSILHSNNYDLATAKYNVELRNYKQSGFDNVLKEKLPQIRCIDAYQQWHQ